ncbi:MAG: phytoene desaturase family protein [Acidimicrobiia bacterium]
MRIVVIGAGLGGLSAACHLVGRGHEVTVIEREDRPGGRAGQIEERGYRIDTGPTVLTMLDLLGSVFNAAGAELTDHLTVRAVDPMYRAVYDDGSVLHVRAGRDAMTEEIRQFAGAHDAAAFGRFADWLRELYEAELPNFIARDFNSPFDLMRSPAAALRLVRLGAFKKLAPTVASYFDDERVQRIFSFQSMYAGLSPMEALAVYSVITYMDTIEGVYFPEGGMHAIGSGLAAAAQKAGVEFQYRVSAERIVRRPSGVVAGVRCTNGETIDADAVVCNVDLPVAYRQLLGTEPPLVARRGRYSPSCAVWVAGVQGKPPADAAHHNIHFGGQWERAFDALLRDGTRMPDPSILVTIPTYGDPTLAPEGRSVIYALEPTPNLDGRIDWTRDRGRIRADLVNRVESLGYPVLAEVERFTDPLDWEAQGMERGTPFALAHLFRQTGPFRPAIAPKKFPGVFFTGSGTRPGVGVPIVLVSGQLTAERVDEWASAR